MVGATNSLPLSFNMLLSVTMTIEGHPELGENAEADCRSVTPGFLQTMGIGLWPAATCSPRIPPRRRRAGESRVLRSNIRQ